MEDKIFKIRLKSYMDKNGKVVRAKNKEEAAHKLGIPIYKLGDITRVK